MRGKPKQQKYIPRHTTGIVGQIMAKLVELQDPEYTEKTQLEVVCQKVIDSAKDGNLMAANMIFDRIEGKPGQAGLPPGALGSMESMSLAEISDMTGVPVHELERRRAAYQLAMASAEDEEEQEEDPLEPKPEPPTLTEAIEVLESPPTSDDIPF